LRQKLGIGMQVIGLVLMPLAFYQGVNDAWSFGTELLVASLGFLLLFVGRGLRHGTRRD
jgi:hypothetical protein